MKEGDSVWRRWLRRHPKFGELLLELPLEVSAPTDAGGEVQEPTEQRSWWRRMFGG